MNKSTILKVGATAAAAMLLLSSCSGGDSAEGGGTAVLYSANNENANQVVVDQAAALDPSIKVDVVTGGSVPLLERAATEGGEKSDVYFSTTRNVLAEHKDLFESYESPEAAEIPEELIDEDHQWTVANQHIVTFMVNTDQMPDGVDAPQTWQDLTDPAWEGKIYVADPLASSMGDTVLYGAYKLLGEEDFAKLAANLVTNESSSVLFPAVAQGEYAVALGYESSVSPFIEGGQPGIEMVYPEDGTFTSYEAIGLFANRANPEEGKRLYDNMLSAETQIELLKAAYRRPVRTDIDPSEYVNIPKLEDINIFPTDDIDEPGVREEFQEYWSSLGV